MKRLINWLSKSPQAIRKRVRASFDALAWSAEARRQRRGQAWRSAFRLPDREEVRSARASLVAVHGDYVRTISKRDWAMSLPLASYLLALIRERRPSAIADSGSGFSTSVIAANAADGTRILSADHSADWLEKTREYLGPLARKVELRPWSEVSSDPTLRDSFDLVVHDLGGKGLRSGGLPFVMEMVRVGGVLVLDDLHLPGYRAVVIHTFKDNPAWRTLSLWPETHEFNPLNRHAWIAIRVA